MKKFTAEKSIKLSDFLLDKYQGGLSYGKFCSLLRKKDIKINGKRAQKDVKLFQGDIIECYFDGEKPQIEVLFQDENVLVCNKPQGITSEDFFKRISEIYKTAYFTHRLDRNTSGVMVFALNEETYRELFEGLKKRAFKKFYHCLINGAFENKSGTLTDYMIKDEKNSTVKIYGEKVSKSKQVVTKYEEVAKGEFSSVLKVELVTGRTHQIRAHLAYHGHFIIGDGKYGSERVNKLFKASSQLLIASSLTFEFTEESSLSYLTGKTFNVDFQRVFDYLK